MDELFASIRATVAEYAMLPATGEGVPLVLMVSGGSDSTALARLMPRLYPRHDYTILHINHQLRGEQADNDERFVCALAEELGLPFELCRIDVATEAKQSGENIEAAGRRLRYGAATALLDEKCSQANINLEQGRILTAHTRDERAETFLMRVIKGGGTGALAAIPAVNGRVVRPLLGCTRAQLRGFLLSLMLSGGSLGAKRWCEDKSNADTEHLRAFVRHEVIPLLEERNPRLTETIARSLDILAAEDAYLGVQAAELIERYVVIDRIPPAPIATVDVALFDHSSVLVHRVLHYACTQVMPSQARITAEHLHAIAAQGARVGFATDIPGDVTVRTVCATLIIRRKSAVEQPNHEPEQHFYEH